VGGGVGPLLKGHDETGASFRTRKKAAVVDPYASIKGHSSSLDWET